MFNFINLYIIINETILFKGVDILSFDLNTDKNKKVHFIGIGGVSMSGLAAVLLTKGYKVSGSDAKESEVLNKLRKSGAEIYIGHNKNNI